MRNRGAYSTKERMPSDIEPPSTNQPGRLYLIGGVLPSRQKLGIGAISPAHPRFSRMYGVTNSTVFQTVLNKRFFYDRRELFCPRILSFRSGSRWVRTHFLGKPQKGLPEKRRTRISMGFATSKAHKRETQGKYFDLDFKKGFYQDV